MLYTTIRIMIFFIIFIVLFVKIRRTKIVKKKLVTVLLLLFCVVFCSVSYFVPVENLFVNFKSPQDVFKYSCNGEIEDVVYGNNSCLIFSADTHNIIPKTKTGYKIPIAFSMKTVGHKIDETGSFNVYHVPDTDDYYIWGTTISIGSNIVVADGNNSQLKIRLTPNDGTDYYTVLVYGLIDNFTDEYYLLINGEKTTIIGLNQ